MSVLCSLLLPQPMVPLTLAGEWREEPHLIDSPAFFCFTFLSFSFHHSSQKAGHLPWHHTDFPGKPDRQCCRPMTSAGGPEATHNYWLAHTPIQLSSMALLHPQRGVQMSISGVGPGSALFHSFSLSSGRGLERTQPPAEASFLPLWLCWRRAQTSDCWVRWLMPIAAGVTLNQGREGGTTPKPNVQGEHVDFTARQCHFIILLNILSLQIVPLKI